MSSDRPPPDECANCGAAIPRRAKACPECGADERTGWRESSAYDGLDLPSDSWSGEAEHETAPNNRNRDVAGTAWYWWVVAVVLLTLLAAGAFLAFGSG